jgi:hypothetical protein
MIPTLGFIFFAGDKAFLFLLSFLTHMIIKSIKSQNIDL